MNWKYLFLDSMLPAMVCGFGLGMIQKHFPHSEFSQCEAQQRSEYRGQGSHSNGKTAFLDLSFQQPGLPFVFGQVHGDFLSLHSATPGLSSQTEAP